MIKHPFDKAGLKFSAFVLSLLFPLCGLFAQQDNTIPDYSTKDRKDVPVEYTWKLDDIYSSQSDWEKDKALVQEKIGTIEKLSKDWTTSAKKMYNMLNLLSQISLKLDRLMTYAIRNQHVDMGNSAYSKMRGEVESIYVLFNTKTNFVNNDILKLGAAKFSKFQKEEKGLESHKFFVEKILRGKDHILSPDKEEIISLSGLFSGSAEQASSMLNNLEIPSTEVTLSDGSKVTLNYSNYSKLRASKNAADRSLVMNAFWSNHKKFENTLAVLLDEEMKMQYFYAKTRRFPDCLQAKLFSNKIDTTVYYQLIRSVNENLEPLQKYLLLKKQLLGIDKYKYEDIYVSAVKSVDKKFTFDEAKKLVLESVKPLGSDYLESINKAFNERWIDIYPNRGKEFGAYSGGLFGVHPYIKLNYNGNYDGVSTLIHELGHSIHSYLTDKYQPYENTGYSIFIAEVASTFNENLLMHYMLKNETDDFFKLYVLDSYLEGVRATIYRQTLFAEFELTMHKKIEKGESLTTDWLNKTYLDLTRKYYGHDKGIMEVGDYIQNEWSNIPHFYMNYYVFQYATGIIGSMALSNMVLNGGEKERDKYLALLKSGGSDYPLELLKKAGVDMTKKASIEAGLKNFSSLVDEMSNLVQKMKAEAKI